METVTTFPSRPHRNTGRPTDAFPLRLLEAINFQALHYGQYDASANDPCMRRPRATRSYLPQRAFDAFRVR